MSTRHARRSAGWLLGSALVPLLGWGCDGIGGLGDLHFRDTTASGGSTTSTSGAGGGCAAPEVPCAGQCVQTDSDAKNCGSCGHDCQGTTCQGAMCQPATLVSGQGSPVGIAVDETHVYWTDPGSGRVMKVAKGGGTPTQLASGENQPDGIAVDGTSAYWTSFVGVRKVPLGGGNAITLAMNPKLRGVPAVGAHEVYWAGLDDAMATAVMKVPIDGGGFTPCAVDPNGPMDVAVDATNLYWSTYYGTLVKMPIGGENPTTLASVTGQGISIHVAVDATDVYWTNPVGAAVMKVPIGGGDPTTLASITQPAGIAVDATSVYWTSSLDGTVMKVAIGGGAPTVLASGQVGFGYVAVDSTSVYWTANGGLEGGVVMKVAK